VREKPNSRADSTANQLSSPVAKNILVPFFGKYVYVLPSRLVQEGRIAIVTTREAGMRWTLWRRARFSCGRTALMRTAKSCGPGAPTLAPSEQNDLLAMGANKPGSQGEHEGNR
jgi:hypothetical protein